MRATEAITSRWPSKRSALPPRQRRSRLRPWQREALEARVQVLEQPAGGVMGVPAPAGAVRPVGDDGVVAHSEADPLPHTIRPGTVAVCRFCGHTIVRVDLDLRPRWLHAQGRDVTCPRRTIPLYS